MAFIKKLWKDRISQFPNRRTINDGSVTKQVTVGRDEGTITEPGDSFDASNMNDLEQRIEDAYGDVVSLVASEVAAQYDQENVIFDPVATEGHGVGFVVSSDYIANLKAGDLKDVNITTPTPGEALVFDADGNLVNGTVSTVGNLDDLSDVDTTGKAEGDSLRYIGGEWKAKPTTVEMTQAEYNAIVDFTPYANTHIVITDAPNLNATASDIEYSSGVSVADKLDEIPTVTATTDTANGKRLSGGYIQIGNIVYVDINIELLSQTDYTKALQTGLPTPIDNKNVQIIGNNYDTWDYQPNAVLYGFRLANGGVYHNVNSPMASGTKLHIFGSYISES